MVNEVAINQKDVATQILTRVDEMQQEGLALPKNYNPSNALQIAFLKIQEMKVQRQPVLDIVSKKSVVETLLNMVLQGLSPAKNQCYFIPYGNQLQMQRSYFGTQAALKRLDGVNDIWAEVIRKGETFEFENDSGRKRLVKHEQTFETLDNEIVGAYAVIDTKDEGQLLEVMTKKQIDASWSQAKSSNVHNKFGDQMAMRTVINRAAKNYINTSDDSDLLIHAINDTTENEYENEKHRKDVTETNPASVQEKDLLEQFQGEKQSESKVLVVEADEEDPIDGEFQEINEDDLNGLADDFKAFREAESSSQQELEQAEISNRLNAEEQVKREEVSGTTGIDFSKLTMDQIKEKLDAKKVEYNTSAKRNELVAVAEAELNGGGLQNELF